jgi:hypothetical protein
VVSDTTNPHPLRSVIVTLNSAEAGVAQSTTTDDRGRFEFGNLPAGRFVLSASRPAYLTVNYGASRVGRPGVPIAIADGARENVTLRLPRGSVITGTIRDEFGQPLARESAFVYALQYQWQNGRRVLGPSPAASAATRSSPDDRGVYRIYGLPPGEYLVVATPGIGPGGLGRELTEGDFLRAKREILGARMPGNARPGGTLATSGAGRTVRWAPVFFPASTTVAGATTIALGEGEERGGVDLSFIPVPIAAISGSVRMADGIAPASVQINMVPSGPSAPGWASGIGTSIGGFGSARPTADGAFTIANVTPGDYTLVARAARPQRGGATGSAGAPAGAAPPQAPTYWAVAQVTVHGQEVTVSLDLQPSKSITGRVVLEGTAASADLSRARVSLAVVNVAGATIGVPPAPIGADGSFTLVGVSPATFRVSVTGLPQPWAVKSAAAAGKDVLDALLDVRPATEISDLTITLTDQPSELTGVLQDTSGRPTSEYVVIVFPDNRDRWTWQSRWIRAVRPGTNGRYLATNLPAGRYRLAAVTDVETNEWFDPLFLDTLIATSIQLTIAIGERKVQDIRIGR